MLLIVMGNALVTYLFEKVIVYYIQVCNQRRLENKRLAGIETEMRDSREDLNNYKKLLDQKTFNQTMDIKGVFSPRVVPLPNTVLEEGDHIGHDVDEKSIIGKIH